MQRIKCSSTLTLGKKLSHRLAIENAVCAAQLHTQARDPNPNAKERNFYSAVRIMIRYLSPTDHDYLYLIVECRNFG